MRLLVQRVTRATTTTTTTTTTATAKARAMSSFTIKHAKSWPPVTVRVPSHINLSESDLETFPPFRPWFDKLCSSLHQANGKSSNGAYKFSEMCVQSVDTFGSGKIGFIKLNANVEHPSGKSLPGIVVLRGGTVGILVVLELDQQPESKYVVLVQQPRIAASSTHLPELPAGMLDDGQFRGQAAKELEEECGIKIDESDDNFSELTTESSEVLLSPGFTDEHIRLFLYTKRISREELDEINGRQSKGAQDENEQIQLKVVPFSNALTATNDAKLMIALALYAKQSGINL